jgi:hypothetical protein
MGMSGALGEDADSFGRMARGSAGIAELVHMMEAYPDSVVQNFEIYAMRKCGVFHSGQAWSLEALAAEHVRKLDGHRTLAKMLVILAHAYEICRQSPSPSNVHVRAF